MTDCNLNRRFKTVRVSPSALFFSHTHCWLESACDSGVRKRATEWAFLCPIPFDILFFAARVSSQERDGHDALSLPTSTDSIECEALMRINQVPIDNLLHGASLGVILDLQAKVSIYQIGAL